MARNNTIPLLRPKIRVQSTSYSPRNLQSVLLNIFCRRKQTGELRLLDRGVQIQDLRIVFMVAKGTGTRSFSTSNQTSVSCAHPEG